MKKLISYVLLLAMCLALFAGCAPKTEADPGLDSAKTYLYNMYKDTAKTTKASYDVVGMVVIQGVGTYNVEWTVNSDAITVTPNGKMVTIGIPEYPEAEINYTLTATIKDDKGNTATVAFEHNVPKAAGQPATLADGTYVIASGNLTMSSLTEDKGYGYPTANEVTIADGKVSNHFKADVLTIKNVEGGVTIQDAYGRYFYLKGTYNSFNVDATMPAEGHIFTVLKSGDSYLIVNAMNKKTLAYITSYSSWGCYPELTEEHQTALTIVPATAPATDPVKPDEGGSSTPAPTPTVGMIENPVAGTAYKMMIVQGNKNANLFFTGKEKDKYPWYILSTQTESESVDVYLEEVTGGLRLYFMVGSTKTYLDMHKDGTHYSLRLTTEPTAVYTWNTEHKTLVATVEGVDCFIGTSGTYDTFSCNKLEKIADSFPAHFYGEGGTTTPDTDKPNTDNTDKPSTGTTVADGTKVVIYNPGDKKYATGKDYLYTSSKGSTKHELELTTDKSAALVLTVKVGSNGNISFLTNDGKYLYCNGTDVKLVDKAEANTEFVLEAASGGYYIRCATATYFDKPQYLEVYSGYLTCYSMGTNTALYIFELQNA